MKKTIIAVVVTGLFAATAAQAQNVYSVDGTDVDVYGRFQFDIRDSGGDSDVQGLGSSRLGFKAKSPITDSINGLGRGEWQLSATNNDGSKFTARHVYAGLEFADAGTVVFGQTDTAFYQAVAATDIFNTYGYAAFSAIEDGRQPGQIVYTGDFGGLYVGASYQFVNDDFSVSIGNPEDPADVETGTALDAGYALTLGYNFDFGLGIYGGYHVEELSQGDKTNTALSANYQINDLYLGAAYVMADLNDTELTGYDFVALYAFDALSIYGGYQFQEGDFDGTTVDTADEATLGVQYKLSSKMKTWIEYNIANMDGAEDGINLAIQYNF